jgi:hypothetical protein
VIDRIGDHRRGADIAACATDPAVTAAVANAIWRNIVTAASY